MTALVEAEDWMLSRFGIEAREAFHGCLMNEWPPTIVSGSRMQKYVESQSTAGKCSNYAQSRFFGHRTPPELINDYFVGCSHLWTMLEQKWCEHCFCKALSQRKCELCFCKSAEPKKVRMISDAALWHGLLLWVQIRIIAERILLAAINPTYCDCQTGKKWARSNFWLMCQTTQVVWQKLPWQD